MISTKTGCALDTDINFPKQDRIG